jgi:hypothetical protein
LVSGKTEEKNLQERRDGKHSSSSSLDTAETTGFRHIHSGYKALSSSLNSNPFPFNVQYVFAR